MTENEKVLPVEGEEITNTAEAANDQVESEAPENEAVAQETTETSLETTADTTEESAQDTAEETAQEAEEKTSAGTRGGIIARE